MLALTPADLLDLPALPERLQVRTGAQLPATVQPITPPGALRAGLYCRLTADELEARGERAAAGAARATGQELIAAARWDGSGVWG
jgi:hypothetical protein